MAAKRRSSPAKRAPKANARSEREFTVILEELRSQMQLVVEAVTAQAAGFDEKLADLKASLGERIARLEDAVRQHSKAIAGLEREVTSLRHDFDHRQELARMTALEERIARVEAKLGVAS